MAALQSLEFSSENRLTAVFNRSLFSAMPYAAAQYEHEEISRPPRGWKVRTSSTPTGAQVRIAYPPGRRRKGSGQVISVLTPKAGNPREWKPGARTIFLGQNLAWTGHSSAEMQAAQKQLAAAGIYGHPAIRGTNQYGLTVPEKQVDAARAVLGNPPAYRKPVYAITDRAKRYRANATPPPGPRRCELCGSTRFLVIDHKDGDESNNRQRNKRWLCKACNISQGARQARRGSGVRTRQYNPLPAVAGILSSVISAPATAPVWKAAKKSLAPKSRTRKGNFVSARVPNPGAKTLAAYTEAALEHVRGAHDYGGAIIHDTPIEARRKFAKEIWRRRRGEPKRSVKLNSRRRRNAPPLAEAIEKYRESHGGRSPREIIEAQRSDQVRQTYVIVGEHPSLDELEIAGPDCDYDRIIEEIAGCQLDENAEIRGTIPLAFDHEGVDLASDPRGHQLYFIGGDQSLDAGDLELFGTDTTKDLVELGPAISVTYQARKPPRFTLARYRHFLGEETGEPPIAYYDRIKQEIGLVGGRYSVKDWIYG